MSASGLAGFFAMGGYGLYVWGSFAMCALVLALELGLLALRRRALRVDAHEAQVGSMKDNTGAKA